MGFGLAKAVFAGPEVSVFETVRYPGALAGLFFPFT
jgi:hypothetical protein